MLPIRQSAQDQTAAPRSSQVVNTVRNARIKLILAPYVEKQMQNQLRLVLLLQDRNSPWSREGLPEMGLGDVRTFKRAMRKVLVQALGQIHGQGGVVQVHASIHGATTTPSPLWSCWFTFIGTSNLSRFSNMGFQHLSPYSSLLENWIRKGINTRRSEAKSRYFSWHDSIVCFKTLLARVEVDCHIVILEQSGVDAQLEAEWYEPRKMNQRVKQFCERAGDCKTALC